MCLKENVYKPEYVFFSHSPDDDGLLLGNWTTDFSGGVAPTKWGGSVEIMQRFYKKKKPVKFAQCWVFAGCLSTIARAVGLPSRIVTNYSSAHDTQASMTVDYFVDDDGKIMEEMNADSIWNYHVWNEIWMARPDLGNNEDGDYDGFQAVDATPQEMSDEMYRCGPASVVAVKRGEILKPYDNTFLYAEVNADKVFWRYTGVGNPLKLLKKDEFGIGHFISTKAIGRWERDDITRTYKFPEKTEEERATMLKALRQANSAFSRYYLNEEFNEVNFNFELKDDIKIGEDFHVVSLEKFLESWKEKLGKFRAAKKVEKTLSHFLFLFFLTGTSHHEQIIGKKAYGQRKLACRNNFVHRKKPQGLEIHEIFRSC